MHSTLSIFLSTPCFGCHPHNPLTARVTLTYIPPIPVSALPMHAHTSVAIASQLINVNVIPASSRHHRNSVTPLNCFRKPKVRTYRLRQVWARLRQLKWQGEDGVEEKDRREFGGGWKENMGLIGTLLDHMSQVTE